MSDTTTFERTDYNLPTPEELAEKEWQEKGPEGILKDLLSRSQRLTENTENILLMMQKAKEEGTKNNTNLLKPFLLPFAGEADDQLIQMNGELVNLAGNLFIQGVKMEGPELEARRAQRRAQATQPKKPPIINIQNTPKRPIIKLFKK